jgi:hypothetical protein
MVCGGFKGRGKRLLCLAALLAGRLAAQDPDIDMGMELARVVPPPFMLKGEINPGYANELKLRAGRLAASDRAAFFRLLRRQQRALERHIEDRTSNLERTRALRGAMAGQGSAELARAEALVEAQREAIIQLRTALRVIEQLRRQLDPQKVDSLPFQADFYAGFQFSSLYKDQAHTDSFFSKSKPFVSLDLRNTFRWPEGEQWIDFFGTLSFQSATKEQSDAVSVITTSGNFKGEMGVWYMRPLTAAVSWGVIASTGLVGYTAQDTSPDLTGSSRDEFRNLFRIGLTLRQEEGLMRTSVAEVAYVHDPLFLHPNRLLVRGQIVLTQFGASGAKGDFYMEGRASKGRSGRDEAVLLLGIRLSTLAFFRSLGGN